MRQRHFGYIPPNEAAASFDNGAIAPVIWVCGRAGSGITKEKGGTGRSQMGQRHGEGTMVRELANGQRICKIRRIGKWKKGGNQAARTIRSLGISANSVL